MQQLGNDNIVDSIGASAPIGPAGRGPCVVRGPVVGRFQV
jgi:hypothetical protein